MIVYKTYGSPHKVAITEAMKLEGHNYVGVCNLTPIVLASLRCRHHVFHRTCRIRQSGIKKGALLVLERQERIGNCVVVWVWKFQDSCVVTIFNMEAT